jgi:hypothetical protein
MVSMNFNARKRKVGTKITLNLYDLSPSNSYLFPIGLGIHHSGIEITGTEYTFASGSGIFSHSPREANGAIFRESIELGLFDGGNHEVDKILSHLREEFHGDTYNIISKNCNHFSNSFAFALLKKPIPSYINRVASIGNICSCLLPKEFAPVSQPSSGYLVQAPSGAASIQRQNKNQSFFSGSGIKLGSGNESGAFSFSAMEKVEDLNLTDRRERARLAAISRLNKNPLN